MVLVQVVQDLVDRLLVAVLDVPEFLSGDASTMLEDCSLLSIGIFYEKCSFLSYSSYSSSDYLAPQVPCSNRCTPSPAPYFHSTTYN